MFVVVDIGVPGGLWAAGGRIFEGVADADRAADRLREGGGRFQVIDALWFEPARRVLVQQGIAAPDGSYGEPKGRRSNASKSVGSKRTGPRGKTSPPNASPMLGWTGKTEAARAEHRRQSLASYFRVKPKLNYEWLGTAAVLDKSKAYWAIDATNQPDWQAKGRIFLQMNPDGSPATKAELDFAEGFLLEKGDYTKVRSKRRSNASKSGGSKRTGPRGKTMSAASWARQDRAVEKRTRSRGRRAAQEGLVDYGREYVVRKVGESWQVQRDGKTVGGKRYLYKAEAVAAAPPGAVILTSKGKLPKRRKNPCGLQHRRPNKLTRGERVTLPDSAFAIPRERKFPIQNKRQAVTALTYATWPENKKYRKRVETAVYKRYPSLKPTRSERREHHVVPPGASRSLSRKTYLRKRNAPRRKNPHDVGGWYELILLADNDGQLYRQRIVPIAKNLLKKLRKKKYDHTQAPKAWSYLMGAAAKRNAQGGLVWHKRWPKHVRDEAAQVYADAWLVEANGGEWDWVLEESRGGGAARRKNPYGTIVMEGATRGGRYSFKVGRTMWKGSPTYNLTQYTSGREDAHGSGFTKAQMVKRVEEMIHWAKEIDGINYKVTKDTLRKTKKRKATPKRRRNVTLRRTTKGKLTKRAELVEAFRRLGWVVDTSNSKNVYVYEPAMLGWTGKSADARAEHRRQSLALTTMRYKIGPKSVRAQKRDSVPTDLRPGGSHPWYDHLSPITLSEALRRLRRYVPQR